MKVLMTLKKTRFDIQF